MSLQRAAASRLRPWHGLMLAVFLTGAGKGVYDLSGAGVGPTMVMIAVLDGLLWVLGFQLTVGNVWAYVVEYYNTGGEFSDTPVALPVGAGLAGGVTVGWHVSTTSAVETVWLGTVGGFGVFVLAALLVRVGTDVAVGYRTA